MLYIILISFKGEEKHVNVTCWSNFFRSKVESSKCSLFQIAKCLGIIRNQAKMFKRSYTIFQSPRTRLEVGCFHVKPSKTDQLERLGLNCMLQVF